MQFSFRTLFPYAVGLLLTGGILAAKAPAEPKAHEYVSVVLYSGELRVSTGAAKFDMLNTQPAGKDRDYNLTPFLGKLTEPETQGYELVETNVFASSTSTAEFPRAYALLRKAK